MCGQQVGLIRPDVMNELMKYPEVFFIHDVPTNDKKFEVCLTTQVPVDVNSSLIFLIRLSWNLIQLTGTTQSERSKWT